MKNKYANFYFELNKLPGLTKEEAVAAFTGGRTRSLRDLSHWDLQELVRRLRAMGPQQPAASSQPRVADPRKKMVNKILYYGHEMGLVAPRAGMPGKNDYSRLHALVEGRGYLKKPLKDYTFGELPKLVSQMEAIYRHWLGKAITK